MSKPTIYKTVGSSVESLYAQNAHGQWFKRSHYRDARYGWKWTRWTPTSAPTRAEWVDGVPGLSDGAWSYGVIEAGPYAGRVRLPSSVEG